MADEIVLNYLGRSYFHQDYDLDAETPIDLVALFAVEDGLQVVQLLYSQLAEILVSGLDEQGARSLWMDDAHSEYDPATDGLSYLGWLKIVLLKVGEILRRRWLTARASLH